MKEKCHHAQAKPNFQIRHFKGIKQVHVVLPILLYGTRLTSKDWMEDVGELVEACYYVMGRHDTLFAMRLSTKKALLFCQVHLGSE